MIKKDAQPIVSDRAKEIENRLSDLIAYRAIIGEDYISARAEQKRAENELYKLIDTAKDESRFSPRSKEYRDKQAAVQLAQSSARTKKIKLDAAHESIKANMTAYVAEMVRANTSTLINECARYKRTEDFIKKMVPNLGLFSCYILGAKDSYPCPYIRVYKATESEYGSMHSDIFLAHDGDILGRDEIIIPDDWCQPGPTPDMIEQAAKKLDEARAIAEKARADYKSAMDRVGSMLSALGKDTVNDVKEGR